MKKLVVGFVALVLVLLAAVVSLPFLIDANQFRPRIESQLTASLGRAVKLGALKLDLFHGAVSADDLSIADDPEFSSSPFLRAHSLKLSAELLPLITTRRLSVQGLIIDQPSIALIQSPQGTWNFASMGVRKSDAPSAPSSGQSFDLSAQLIQITGGRISVTLGSAPPIALESLEAQIHNFSPAASFPFTLAAKVSAGGQVNLDGKAGPINSTDASATPLDVKMKLAALPMAGSGLVDKTSGLDGLLSVEGTGTSDGTQLHWNGALRVNGLKIARNGKPDTSPVEFDCSLVHNMHTRGGVLDKGDLHIGKAFARLTGTYAAQGEKTSLQLHLIGTAMPIPELASMLPPLDIRLPNGASLQDGTASLDATMNGVVPVISTDASLKVANTKLAGFDLGSKLSTVEKLAGIKSGPDTTIQSLNANIHETPAGQTINDLKLVVPAIGEIDGGGTISSTHTLDFKLRANVRSTGGLTAILGPGGATVPFFIQGTAESPQFRPDLKGLANEQVKRLESNDAVKSVKGILGGILGGKK